MRKWDTLVVSCMYNMFKLEIIVFVVVVWRFLENRDDVMYILSDDDVKIIIYDWDEGAEREMNGLGEEKP